MIGKYRLGARQLVGSTAVLLLFAAETAQAQTEVTGASAAAVARPSPPAPAVPSTDGLEPPKLDFAANPKLAQDFDKYFYFHRPGTTFAEAHADIRECHALAGGKVAYRGRSEFAEAYTISSLIPQYGLAGGIGGALGGALVGLIVGGGNGDKVHRINLRNCMGFKGYQRYGLPKDLWEEFNLSPDKSRKNSAARERAFKLQALAASGAQPKQEAIGQ